MNLKLLIIFCAFLYHKNEITAETATCQYTKNDIFIFFMKNPGYSCEFAINTKTFESVTDIDGDHTSAKADGNVNILLSYQSSKIREFSSIFCEKFSNLEAIKLENVKIKSFDDVSLQQCQSLRLLHLNHNDIEELPENLFSENSELKEIEINSNKLTTLHEQTFEMQENLKKLFLNKNKIQTMPSKVFESLGNLERLHLDENQIEILDPMWFKDLGKLEKLLLNSNKINDLPIGVFANLKNLQLLELNSNHLTAIYADSFGVHRSLTNVHLSFNNINGIDSNFILNSPISMLLMEDNKCFKENVTRRDLMDDDLETCFNNFNNGRLPPRPSLITTTSSTSTTSTTVRTTPEPTTTTQKPKITTTELLTTTTSEQTTTTRVITTRPIRTLPETSTTHKPETTTPRIVLPKDKYGVPHPMIPLPDIKKNQFARGAYPWIAAILKNGNYRCGGVLVSDRKVVTAGRCMYQKYKGENKELFPRDLMVVLGSHSIYEKFEMRKTSASVYRIRIHPDFNINSAKSDADVTVLILNDIVNFVMFVRPIVLMNLNPESVTVTDGVVVSYGQQGSMKAGSNVTPRQVQTEINDNQECSISSNEASDRTFCGKSDLCTEDVGSGLFIKYHNHYYLRGIASTVVGVSNGVCNEHSKTVFTDIYKFSKWIDDEPTEDQDDEDE